MNFHIFVWRLRSNFTKEKSKPVTLRVSSCTLRALRRCGRGAARRFRNLKYCCIAKSVLNFRVSSQSRVFYTNRPVCFQAHHAAPVPRPSATLHKKVSIMIFFLIFVICLLWSASSFDIMMSLFFFKVPAPGGFNLLLI